MEATITIRNGLSSVECPGHLLDQLRELVSFQAVDLPPIPVQQIIRDALRRVPPDASAPEVIELIYRDPVVATALAQHGYTPDGGQLTVARLMNTTNQRGLWDGWQTVVSSAGEFGTGLVDTVARALTLRLGAGVRYEDARHYPPPCGPSSTGVELYDWQREAVDAFFAAGGRGVLNFPPRSGKTRMAIEIVLRLGLPTLVVVPTRNLVEQTVARFREWLPDGDVAAIAGRQSHRRQRRLNQTLVWVATPQTAAGRKPKGRKRARRTGMRGLESRVVLVADEFHHSSASTWQDISVAARNAYWRLGLTGTHYRADGTDMLMRSVLSRAVASASVQDMVDLGRLVPARIAVVRVPRESGDLAARGRSLYGECVVRHRSRNALAAGAMAWLAHYGKRTLVLVKEVAHGQQLRDAFVEGGYGDHGVRFVSSTTADVDEIQTALADLEAGRIRCLIGTSVIGEGVDVPAADALVYAAGGKSPVKVVQDYFRVLTRSPGKTHGVIVDFADDHNPRTVKAAARRLALYRQEEAFSSEVMDPDDLPKWLESTCG